MSFDLGAVTAQDIVAELVPIHIFSFSTWPSYLCPYISNPSMVTPMYANIHSIYTIQYTIKMLRFQGRIYDLDFGSDRSGYCGRSCPHQSIIYQVLGHFMKKEYDIL